MRRRSRSSGHGATRVRYPDLRFRELDRVRVRGREALERFRRRWPGSALSGLYLERIARLREDPPGDDWDGGLGPG